jgi:aspartate-semialdehyde dehydrogenase
VSATCVRVPVLRAHSVVLAIECERPMTPEEARDVLKEALGIRVVDDTSANLFPMPSDASGQDDVLVGRIRRDLSDGTGRSLSLFACGDQLLKGAALNAVQIAERLVSELRDANARSAGHHGRFIRLSSVKTGNQAGGR